MFSRLAPASEARLPDGERIYAIGDVHGESGLLEQILRLIHADNIQRGDESATLILLGDLIDRGPDAADLLMTFSEISNDRLVVLKGNHEAALVQAYNGDEDVLGKWMPFGAPATLAGLGMAPDELRAPTRVLLSAMRERIPPTLIDWLADLPTHWQSGDYYFVHAGIQPGVRLEDQDEDDLLWMREPFLSSRRFHGKVIVHGHTIERARPQLGGNRIGLDTGAHEHGVLSAIGLQGDRQWLIQAMRRDTKPAVMRDIERLVADIIGADATEPRSLNLAMPVAGAQSLHDRRLPARTRSAMGTRGVVATGFAFAALAAGAAAFFLGPRLLHPAPGAAPAPDGIAVPVPTPAIAPKAPETANPISTRFGSAKVRTLAKRTVRRAAGAAPSGQVAYGATGPGPGDPPRLTGAALEKALAEDREATRLKNLDEASRLPLAATGRQR